MGKRFQLDQFQALFIIILEFATTGWMSGKNINAWSSLDLWYWVQYTFITFHIKLN